jgi:hypothetical protein
VWLRRRAGVLGDSGRGEHARERDAKSAANFPSVMTETIPMRPHDLFKDEVFDRYIDPIRGWAAEFFGLVIPGPNEVYTPEEPLEAPPTIAP